MEAINEVPEQCPECKDMHLNTAVEVTMYDGQYCETNFEKPFDPEGEPHEQPVRVFCSGCGYYARITEELADKLAVHATHE